MAVSIIETIKSRANAGNTAYIVVVKLLCDDYSDLPAQSGLSGYELAQGCMAHVINENKDYMIDSSGNWHVYGGDSWTNVYTKSETDALLEDKQDELTTAQLDAVNSGITAAKLTELTAKEQQNENNILSAYGGIVGKNAAKENDFTATLNKTVYCNPITGRIHISAASVSSTDTDSTICRFILYYTDGTDSSTNYSFSRGSNIDLDINIGAKIIERIVIYASNNYSNSIGDTVTVSDLMICTQADYVVDPTYQPYIMSNAELTAAIQALQSN